MQKTPQTKTCKWFWENFYISQADLEMIEKISPVIWWKKYVYDLTDLSPKAREINRLMFRNERKFYKIKLKNGKTDISTVHEQMRENLVTYDEFYEYDTTEFWVDYSWDFNADFKKVLLSSPYSALITVWMDNSAYCNQEAYDKNCYMNSWWHENEDSFYNTFAIRSKDVVDNYWVFNSSVVLESINIFDSQRIFFSHNVKDSFNCFFSYDLKWCHNVIFWVGMENADYTYKNKQLSKEDWEKKYSEIKEKLKTRAWIRELENGYREFLKETWTNYSFIEKSENVSWNYVSHSKDCYNVFYAEELENTRNVNIAWDLADSMDINSFADWVKLYNVASSYKYINWVGSSHILESNNVYNSFLINAWESFFWCYWFWLKNKSYMILNKQYSKKDWEEKVVEIIKELKSKQKWGKFFPPELSPYPYNDSVAYEHYPIKEAVYLKNNEILKKEIINPDGIWIVYILEPEKFISDAMLDFWWQEKIKIKWRTKETEIDINDFSNKLVVTWDLNIDEIDNTILEKVIICNKSKRPYRIIKKELEFYKKYSIALPDFHYEIRHNNRIGKR